MNFIGLIEMDNGLLLSYSGYASYNLYLKRKEITSIKLQ